MFGRTVRRWTDLGLLVAVAVGHFGAGFVVLRPLVRRAPGGRLGDC